MKEGTFAKEVTRRPSSLGTVLGCDLDGSRVDEIHVVSFLTLCVHDMALGEMLVLHVFREKIRVVSKGQFFISSPSSATFVAVRLGHLSYIVATNEALVIWIQVTERSLNKGST